MKKFDKKINLEKKDQIIISDYPEDFKTTNINILLNRVRLDQKKSIKKKIIFLLIFVTLLCGLISYIVI